MVSEATVTSRCSWTYLVRLRGRVGVGVRGRGRGRGRVRVSALAHAAEPRLQPYVSQAATLCLPGCNPMYPRLQPYVSRRSAHSNAFFTGFGATKRVALFDTLVAQVRVGEP